MKKFILAALALASSTAFSIEPGEWVCLGSDDDPLRATRVHYASIESAHIAPKVFMDIHIQQGENGWAAMTLLLLNADASARFDCEEQCQLVAKIGDGRPMMLRGQLRSQNRALRLEKAETLVPLFLRSKQAIIEADTTEGMARQFTFSIPPLNCKQ